MARDARVKYMETKKKQTQGERILTVFKNTTDWINGQYFLRTMMISQFHARILELQRKGHKIEASDFTDEYNFKSYRLKQAPEQGQML